MQLVTALLATMALSVWQLVQSTTTEMTVTANCVISCVWVGALDQGILLAKEDAMSVILSTLIKTTHRYPVLHNAQPAPTDTSWSKP